MARGGISTAERFGSSGAPVASEAPVARYHSEGRQRPVESWTLTEADVDAWLRGSRQGDVLVYAHGPSLIQGAAAARVRVLIDSHEVIALPQRRAGDGGFDYRIARNRVRTVTERPPVCDPHMMAVLLVLQDAAAAGERCPSDADMGARTGLSAEQVKWQLRKLQSGKFIQRRFVPIPGDPKYRVVKVVATGAETAMPGARS